MFIFSEKDFNCINTQNPEKVTRKEEIAAFNLNERVDETITFIPFVISKSPKRSPLNEKESTLGIRFNSEITEEKKSITPVIFIRLSILFLMLKERAGRKYIFLFSFGIEYFTLEAENEVIIA